MRPSPLLLLACGLLGFEGASAFAQSLEAKPLTREILISVSDVTSRLRPGVAADRAGRFVVAWREIAGQDGGVAGRQVSAAGVPIGSGFVIAPRNAGLFTTDPRVAARADGGFLVAWGEAAFPQPGCARARSFALAGQEVVPGDVFDLGPCASENGRAPDVALAGLPDGRFITAWEEGQASSPTGFDVVVRAFASPQEPLTDPLRVDSTGATGDQTAPAVAMDAAGRAFALWHEDGGAALMGRRFDAAGQPLGEAVRINGGLGFPVQAALASSWSGGFVAVWSSFAGTSTRIVAQRLDGAGHKRGQPLAVSPPDSRSTSPRDPAVAMDAVGNFVVVWAADRVDGAGTGVVGRLFDRDGVAQGEPFRINVTAPGSQGHPAVAFGRGDRFLVVWDSQKSADARGSIVGRLYLTFRPVLP